MSDPPTDVWTYRAQPDFWSSYGLGVIDGDTWALLVDKGFRDYERVTIRASRLDTAEIWNYDSQDEYEAAIRHRAFVIDWMRAATEGDDEWPLRVRTRGESGKYGRWLAEVYNDNGASLQDALIAAYDGTDHFDYE